MAERRLRLRVRVGALVLLAAAPLGAWAQSPGEQGEQGDRGAQEDAGATLTPREELRRRWEAMDETERATFRERFEKLARMSPEDRRHFEQRARDLELELDELRRNLSPELERRLADLPPERRDEVLREFVRERHRVRGVRLRKRLPPEFIVELEQAPPEQRPGLVQRYQDEMRRCAERNVLGFLKQRMRLPDEELERIEALEGRERVRAVLELKREHLRRRVGELGPPPGLDAEGWDALDRLPLEEFFERWHARRPIGEGRGARRAETEGAGEDPPLRHPWIHRGVLLERLGEVAAPTLEDLVEHAELDPRERRERVAARVRERCRDFLREAPILPPEDLERLNGLDDAQYLPELWIVLGRLERERSGHGQGEGPWQRALEGLRERRRGEAERRGPRPGRGGGPPPRDLR